VSGRAALAATRARGRWAALAVATAALAACPEPVPGGDAGDAADGDGLEIGAPPIVDELSRPATPTLAARDFVRASLCGACHARHAQEWGESQHGRAISDPVFQALVAVRQADFDGAQDSFCMQCHTPIGTRGGEVTPGFTFAALSPIVREGVTCEVCHKATRVVRPFGSGLALDAAGPVRGPRGSATHGGEASAMFEGSELCAACHDVVELSGLPLERPYAEWLESPAAAEGESCQDCHMPVYRGAIVEGGGPERDLHRHDWVGVDVPLGADVATRAAARARVAALLEGACALGLDAPTGVADGEIALTVTIENQVRGHALPTGSTFIRQVWLEVVATDADGVTLYTTGTLDDNGDLMDHWSELAPYGDPDLVTFDSSFVDARGAPELFPWRAAEHTTQAIQAGHTRTLTLFLPVPAAARGPVTIGARVRLRTHPPFLLRALGLDALVSELETYDLDAATLEVPLGAP